MVSPNPQEANPLHLGARHVAIIMDGNGRWAKRQGKLRVFGHKAGVKSVRRAVSFAASNRLEALTLYAFSSENWNRSIQEVSALMELFVHALDSDLKSLHKHNVKLRVIGDISRFSKRLQERIHRSEQLTKNNNGLTLNIAANYGGRWDIIQGVKKLAEQVQGGMLRSDQISEELLSQCVCMSDLAPVDLVIRTGGEHRISNFLLWQIAYAELYFTDVLWPDFDEHVFQDALNAFAQRERRFGGTIPIVSAPMPLGGNMC
ncbi:MAG: (2E,6E)-farnesyl-diphosphate-specific ditrans,polycis-undecaprenyl-diphosphate synthase [Serratia symbiotica]|nr:(2E,6E)-farnesyl-diphosphate-specific ditrans,polycis-undecaprenyl-diphosphate synthase [Serratia symbiotica]